MDPWVAVAGAFVGFTVGLTGMGGGALMTPLLVLVFHVNPLAAVSSDVVASLVMKPIGGSVHLRRGTVNTTMVKWLCVGSVPSAFGGVLLLDALGDGAAMQDRIRFLLGGALLLAALSIGAKSVVVKRRGSTAPIANAQDVAVKVWPTVLIGAVGGLVVGMTSVGAGSLMIVGLLLLYPRLQANQLVGTDLVQAVPLVAAASLGHLLFGSFELGITTSLLVGAVPAVYLGARVSAKAPDHLIRPALVAVLLVSGLKLLGVATAVVGVLFLLLALTGGGVLARQALLRRRTLATRTT